MNPVCMVGGEVNYTKDNFGCTVMSCRHHIIVILVFKCRAPKINQLDSTRFWKVLEEGTILGWSYRNLHCK